MILKKNNLFINPQGIGDLAIPIKYFISNLIDNKSDYNDFIIQYESQKRIIKKYNKSKSHYFFSKIFYKFNLKNFKKLNKIRNTFYENVFIDPNIHIIKAILISIMLRSNNKIFKEFIFHKFFFAKSLKYSKQHRKKYYQKLSRQFVNTKSSFKIKKKNEKKIIYGIAPGTGGLEKHKRWNWENFANLINNSKIKPDEVYIFGNEIRITNLIKKKIKIKTRIINYSNINKSIEKLLSLKMIITNDNGIANFAAIYGIRSFIICGPSIPNSIKNFTNVKIIKKKLPCSPCYDKMRFGCGNPICLTEFSSDLVSKKIGLS